MPENMCFTDAEKRDLISKVNQHDNDLSTIRNTIRVSVTLASLFMGIIISGSSWYLTGKMEQLDEQSLSDRETVVALEYITRAIEAHQTPRNHPDNTVRVDRLVDDVRELTVQVRNIIQRLGSLQQ